MILAFEFLFGGKRTFGSWDCLLGFGGNKCGLEASVWRGEQGCGRWSVIRGEGRCRGMMMEFWCLAGEWEVMMWRVEVKARVKDGVGLNKRGDVILWSGLDSLVGWGMDLVGLVLVYLVYGLI